MNSFHLNIITPENPFLSEDVTMVILKTTEGDLAVLKNKSPLFAILKAGRIRIFSGNEERTAEIDSGYINIDENNATIVTDSARWSGGPDKEQP